MQPDFSVVQAEFEDQIAALNGLADLVKTAKAIDPAAAPVVAGVTLTRPSALSENTMAASAVVMLASYFESFIRAQVEEYAKGVLHHYAAVDDASKSKIVGIYWKSSLSRLSRLKPKEDPTWASKASVAIAALQQFPLQSDGSRGSADLMCEHDNNMRWEVIKELSGRVGVKSLAEKMYVDRPLRGHLGASNAKELGDALTEELQEFQELRNQLVHSIRLQAGIGFSIYERYRDSIEHFSRAFSNALSTNYPRFEREALRGRVSLAG